MCNDYRLLIDIASITQAENLVAKAAAIAGN